MASHPKSILIINNAEPDIRQFVEPLIELVQQHSHLQYQQIEYRQLDPSSSTFVDPQPFDAVLMSASPRGDDIVASHVPLYRWLLEWKKPAFGICAGHQIPGSLFGAQLIRSSQKEVGRHQVQIVQQDPIFSGMSETFEVEQQHHDAITCPREFVVLCESNVCPVQMIRHRDRPFYTTQFHAEITNPELIRNFLSGCGLLGADDIDR